jgi:predicted nuclease with TOPRIM domain
VKPKEYRIQRERLQMEIERLEDELNQIRKANDILEDKLSKAQQVWMSPFEKEVIKMLQRAVR